MVSVVSQVPVKSKPQYQHPQKQQARDSQSSADSQVNLPEFYVSDRSRSSASSAASELSLPGGTEFCQHTSQQRAAARWPVQHAADAEGVAAGTFASRLTDEDQPAAHTSFINELTPLVAQQHDPTYGRPYHKHPAAAQISMHPKAATAPLMQHIRATCKRAASSLSTGWKRLACGCLGQLPEQQPAALDVDFTECSSNSGPSCEQLSNRLPSDAPIKAVNSVIHLEVEADCADCECLLPAAESAAAEPLAAVITPPPPAPTSVRGQMSSTAGRGQATSSKPSSSRCTSRKNSSSSMPAGTKQQPGSSTCKSATSVRTATKLPRVATLAGASSRRIDRSSSIPRCDSTSSSSARSSSIGEVGVTVTNRTTKAPASNSNSRRQAHTGSNGCSKAPLARSTSATSATVARRTASSKECSGRTRTSRRETKSVQSESADSAQQQPARPTGLPAASSSCRSTVATGGAVLAGSEVEQPNGSRHNLAPMAAYVADNKAAGAQQLLDSGSTGESVPASDSTAAAAAAARVKWQAQAGTAAEEVQDEQQQQQQHQQCTSSVAQQQNPAVAILQMKSNPRVNAAVTAAASSSSDRPATTDPRSSTNNNIQALAADPCVTSSQLGSGSSSSKTGNKCVSSDHQPGAMSSTSPAASQTGPTYAQRNISSSSTTTSSSRNNNGRQLSSSSRAESLTTDDSQAVRKPQMSQQLQQQQVKLFKQLQQLRQQQEKQEQELAAAASASGRLAAAAASGTEGQMCAEVSGLDAVEDGHQMQHDRWQLVRVCQTVPCCARDGTVQMETVHGGLELFQCNTLLHPGSLAAAHITTGGSSSSSRVWLFCPDPLCVLSHPTGSEELPPWPWHICKLPGVLLSKDEVSELQAIGIQVVDPEMSLQQ